MLLGNHSMLFQHEVVDTRRGQKMNEINETHERHRPRVIFHHSSISDLDLQWSHDSRLRSRRRRTASCDRSRDLTGHRTLPAARIPRPTSAAGDTWWALSETRCPVAETAPRLATVYYVSKHWSPPPQTDHRDDRTRCTRWPFEPWPGRAACLSSPRGAATRRGGEWLLAGRTVAPTDRREAADRRGQGAHWPTAISPQPEWQTLYHWETAISPQTDHILLTDHGITSNRPSTTDRPRYHLKQTIHHWQTTISPQTDHLYWETTISPQTDLLSLTDCDITSNRPSTTDRPSISPQTDPLSLTDCDITSNRPSITDRPRYHLKQTIYTDRSRYITSNRPSTTDRPRYHLKQTLYHWQITISPQTDPAPLTDVILLQWLSLVSSIINK